MLDFERQTTSIWMISFENCKPVLSFCIKQTANVCGQSQISSVTRTAAQTKTWHFVNHFPESKIICRMIIINKGNACLLLGISLAQGINYPVFKLKAVDKKF